MRKFCINKKRKNADEWLQFWIENCDEHGTCPADLGSELRRFLDKKNGNESGEYIFSYIENHVNKYANFCKRQSPAWVIMLAVLLHRIIPVYSVSQKTGECSIKNTRYFFFCKPRVPKWAIMKNGVLSIGRVIKIRMPMRAEK